MDSLISRYRSITLLIVVLVGQFILLAYQVKNNNDVPLIRTWAVTAILPIAEIAETTRGTIYGVFHNYFDLTNARTENREMRVELNKLKLENQFLQTELGTADRVKALAAFEKQTPSKLLAARIVGAATTSASKIVFLDRGANAGVEKGMAVITPDGIVGKVLAAYPTASQALLASDPGFAAGVMSQKSRVRGILRGVGSGKCKVDNVQNEEKVDVGEMFYTSGDDRIFPRGLPVGKAAVVRDGTSFKDILVYPSGLQAGPEEVLIVLNGVHQDIPEYEEPSDDQKVYLGAPVPEGKTDTASQPVLSTEADRIREKYAKIGEAEGHKYGEGSVPNFNVPIPSDKKPAAAQTPGATTAPVKPTPTPIKPAQPMTQSVPPPTITQPVPLASQRPRISEPKKTPVSLPAIAPPGPTAPERQAPPQQR